jgi:hypothetical protein
MIICCGLFSGYLHYLLKVKSSNAYTPFYKES